MTSKPGASKVKSGISRRTVVAGTAWAVPAIVVASAAPAMALSGPVTFTGRACKSPGNPKQYLFELNVTNTTNAPLVINATSLTVDSNTSQVVCQPSATIPAQSTQRVTFIAGIFPNSQNGFATFNYTYGPVGGPFVAGSASSQFNNTIPPIQNPDCPLTVPNGCTVIG